MTTKTKFPVRESHPMLHVRYSPASGSNMIAFVLGAWRTANPDTIVKNDLGAGLTSNQITGVPAGTYRIVGAHVSVYGGAGQAIRLYNVTGAAELVRETSAYHDSASRNVGDGARLHGGHFTLAATSTLELQFYTVTANTIASALGISAGINEIFHELIFERVG